MAWTAPMTAVAGSVFTASQFNTHIRDNLAECAPSKATTPGSHFVTSATNQIVERIPVASAALGSSGTTTSSSFTDLDSPAEFGPSVTAITGSSALVWVHGSVTNSGSGSARMCYEVSGASSIAPADNRGIGVSGSGSTIVIASAVHLHTDLTPGTNMFTAKFRVSASTGTFGSRRIGVLPF